MTVTLIVAGTLGVIWILNDIFKQVLVPRAVEGEFRVSVLFSRLAWRTWRRAALWLPPGQRREDFLGLFAPLAFVLLIALWLFGLIFFFGLILYGLRFEIRPVPQDFGSALYFAASSVLTIGYGDFVGSGAWARIVALCAGASGIGTVAITIAFIFLLVGAFQQRERFVVVLDTRAGAPPSGLALLETYASLGLLRELAGLFRESGAWVADVLDSHLAYPLLMFFRSSHKDESWVAALGALLDAAALLVTVIDDDVTGEARLFLDVGMHLTHDLAAYYALPESGPLAATAGERAMLCSRLKSAGFKLRDNPAAWEEFYTLRISYGTPLEGIAARWLITTAKLLGERTALPGHD